MTEIKSNELREFPEAKILDIDLTSKKIIKKSLDSNTYRMYPGGSALATYLLLKEMKPGVDALGPENLLIFTVSPFTGLPISGQSRVTVACKSPLTGGCGDSQAGGFFPAHFKGNGYDAIIFRGKSENPVYVYVNGDQIEIKDAKNVWGKVTRDAEDVIKSEIGDDKIEIAQIGPAGENLVKFACIMNESTRANGRNGVGAVMGSKKLKALVVHKVRGQKPYNKEEFNKFIKDEKRVAAITRHSNGFGKYGTASTLDTMNASGFLPTKNFQEGQIENAQNIGGRAMVNTGILKGRDTCYACSVRCKRVIEIPGKVDPKYGGPEYETCGTFGSSCGNDNLEIVCICNQLCNMYGLDTISCGVTIAFAIDCFENEIIDLEKTDGLELTWGNGEVLPKLVEKIAKREGIGDILAEGSKRASQKFGLGAEKLSMTVKNQEIPMHMPRHKQGLGVIYSVNPFGADHNSSEHDTIVAIPGNPFGSKIGQIGTPVIGFDSPQVLNDDKMRFMFDTQCFSSLIDTLCLCNFVWGDSWQPYGPSDLLLLCKYGIGWDVTMAELMEIGRRKITMMRAFNARVGFTKKEDKLPERCFQPMPSGPGKGISINKELFKKAQDIYYELAGWDKETGNPTPSTLKSLGLDWLI
ncbi:MAG: aldehyde ferredoxin oxidoreductase family protein [Promethearchaeota archaeon]